MEKLRSLDELSLDQDAKESFSSRADRKIKVFSSFFTALFRDGLKEGESESKF